MYGIHGMWAKQVVERAPNTKIHIPVKENNGSPNKNSKCCTKIKILEAFLFISTITHILVFSIGISILRSQDRKYVEIGGYEFYASQAGEDLVTVGILGTSLSLVAIIGMWKKSRAFLIPMVFYLTVFFLVDFTSFIAYFFHYSWKSDDLFENIENLEVIKVGNDGLEMVTADNPDLSSLMTCLFIKIVANIIFIKLLLDVYRKDVMMRTSRSPLRNVGKTTPVQVVIDEDSPVRKTGKYFQI